MHLVIPGLMVIQLEEDSRPGESPELKVPLHHQPIDKTVGQEVDSKVISSAAPEKSGCPPGQTAGGVAF